MKLSVQNCAQCAVKWLQALNVIFHCQFQSARISARENFLKVHKLKNHILEHFINSLTLE